MDAMKASVDIIDETAAYLVHLLPGEGAFQCSELVLLAMNWQEFEMCGGFSINSIQLSVRFRWPGITCTLLFTDKGITLPPLSSIYPFPLCILHNVCWL
jgi:hypothetical protein